jgi:poly(3-hydroxybutyrate) depolymerase
VFNGSRFRAEVAPRISDFMLTHDRMPKAQAVKPALRAVS